MATCIICRKTFEGKASHLCPDCPPPPVRCNALLGACMYGVRPELPVRGFPPGRIRIRQRNTGFPSAFVKTANGIRHFIIAELDGHWVPYAEQGANHTPNPSRQDQAARKEP